jgi:hypothetical protein
MASGWRGCADGDDRQTVRGHRMERVHRGGAEGPRRVRTAGWRRVGVWSVVGVERARSSQGGGGSAGGADVDTPHERVGGVRWRPGEVWCGAGRLVGGRRGRAGHGERS